MTSEAGGGLDQRFLTPGRIAAIAKQAELLLGDPLWAERRTETVAIVDDTAIRRKVSVDFSLRRPTPPLPDPDPTEGETGDAAHRPHSEHDSREHLYCAPAFALPKAPANLMAFDLV